MVCSRRLSPPQLTAESEHLLSEPSGGLGALTLQLRPGYDKTQISAQRRESISALKGGPMNWYLQPRNVINHGLLSLTSS